jgi:hypothetical protein
MDITTTGAGGYGVRIATTSSLTLNTTTITGANMTGAVLVDDGMVNARDFLMQSTGVGLQTIGSNSTALLTGDTLNVASWGLSAYVSSTITGARLQITTSGNTPAVISK